MSFTLNQVTRRAGGGDIVRSRELTALQISVGRGSDCDIQLQDLAVSLRHAEIRQTGPSEIAIQATGRQPFELDGKFVSQAQVAIDGPHTLVFGSHTLTLTPSEKTQVLGQLREIVITVTRNETAPTAADEDEEKIFSIKDSILGKRSMAWGFGLLVIALALAWPIAGYIIHSNARIHADQQWSSGPLSQSHAFLGKNCQACHVKAFVAVRDDACMACHRLGKNQAENEQVAALNHKWGGPVPANLVLDHAGHSRLLVAAPLPPDLGGKIEAVFRRTFNHPNDRCASCHLEHIEGKGPPAAAGAPPAPIRAIPTLMTINRCTDCHDKLKERLGDTTLIDTPDWGRHPDFRPRIAVSLNAQEPQFERVSLVGRPMESNGLTFSHQIHLNPLGGVARMAQELGPLKGYGGPLDCAGCHRPDPTGKGFVPVDMVRDCSACHSLAYARIGGQLRMLPHGHPDQVVEALRGFYSSGGAAKAAQADTTRRLPGFMEDVRAALGRFTASFTTPAAVSNGVKQVFSPGGVCAECHTVLRPAEGSLAYGIAPVYLNDRYLPRGDFNHGIPAHNKDAQGRYTCTTCHQARTSNDAREVLLPRLEACAACHGKSPKQIAASGSTSATSASADCAECHSYHAPGEASPKAPDQEHIAQLGGPPG